MSKQNTSGSEIPDKEGMKDHPVISSLILSITSVFTILFFSPMEIFLGNQNEFVVGLTSIALPLFLASLAAAAIMELFFLFLLKLNRKVFEVFSRLVMGLLLALYIQGLLLNGKMGDLADRMPAFNVSDTEKRINFLLDYFIAFTPLVIYAAGTKKKENRFFQLERCRGILCASSVIFIMQLTGLIGTFLTSDLHNMRNTYNRNLSYGPVMTASEEQNILVFVFDRMDGFLTDEALEKYPDLYDELSGFTYYQNNISHNTNTFPSVPQMATGVMYDDDSGISYLERAWDSETIPAVFKKNGWNVGLVIDRISSFNNIDQLEKCCDNVREDDKSLFSINYLHKGGIIPTMAHLSLIKHVPYMLKNDLSDNITSDFSVGFINCESDEIVPSATGVTSDLKFWSYLKEHGVKIVPDGKYYNFIHLNGIHEVDERIADIYGYEGNCETPEAFRGDMEIILEYLRQLKKNGVYDNTTVVILGDHGRGIQVASDYSIDLTEPLITGLMIKPAGAPDEPMKTDSLTEMSNDFLTPSLLEYAGIDHSDRGYSYNDIIDKKLHPDRFLQMFLYLSDRTIEYRDLYKVTGNARNFDNWERQPEHE